MKIAIRSVTLGKLWRRSTPARNGRRPGKRMRDSAYPAIEEMSSTTIVVLIAKMKVLIVSGMIGDLNRSASTVSGAHRKRQFSMVKGVTGRKPSIRRKKDE